MSIVLSFFNANEHFILKTESIQKNFVLTFIKNQLHLFLLNLRDY